VVEHAAIATPSATAAVLAADAGVVLPKIVGGATAATPATPATPKKVDLAQRPAGAPLAAPPGAAPKEPSIVRDPGF
ncbi:MAG: hypothetical protein JWO86_1198, partial [Myxococcaceae bacterium]|nr:hypothetical protein [Myxococcaceae bacterium]